MNEEASAFATITELPLIETGYFEPKEGFSAKDFLFLLLMK